MRLHHLAMTAFGPFADRVEVDFDALSAAGLFLLTGATGAGKTSVLDAVCFALYGQVPGDRASAKHLRSDHAEASRAPEVVLDLSIGERRFRFTRSPAWSRPKLRGDGETKVQAHVVVEEHRAGTWTPVTNRLDEAGLLVSDLLGMTCGQFTQVAMLPQGRFQAFLRASSAERHAVLQQLFRTDRFERVERWLVERRTEARRASERAAAAVRGVLHRIEEAGATGLPADLEADLAQSAERGLLAGWADEVRAGAAHAHETAAAATRSAEERDAVAAEELHVAQASASLIRRAQTAAAELASLEARREEHELLRCRLALHHQAAPVGALAVRVAQGPELDAATTRDALVDALREARQAHAAARAFLPRQRELSAARERDRSVAAELAEAAEALAAVDVLLELLPASLAAADARQQVAATAVARLDGAQAEVDRLQGLVTALGRAKDLGEQLVVARTDLQGATACAQAAREAYLDAREARINGMAAEVAGALVSGCSCPVCGSAEHPTPAHGDTGAVGRAEEDEARRAHEDAAFVVQNHQVLVAGLESELASLTAQLDDHDADALEPALAAAVVALGDLAVTAADFEPATADTSRLAGELAAARARAEELRIRAAALAAEQDERATQIAVWEAERVALLGDTGDGDDTDLAELVAQREQTVQELDGVLRAWDDVAALEAAARDAGFAGAEAAVSALLDPAEATAIGDALAQVEARGLAARSALDDPEVHAVAGQPLPDLEGIAAARADSARVLRVAAAAADSAGVRAKRLSELGDRLDEALAAWAPLRAQHRLTAELAALVEGRSVDNPLRMRLAAYVLAERLRQVVAAANERLTRMTGDRYALEHSDDRGAGEQRGGLSLRVRDDWNGVHRDPATLSGGETFVVSLALALGLADTVAHEAGGTDIDTLFIDEGFGSLDADTLEDVMDTLDALRDGGRVVGLVSHVPELRSRITTQLEVAKGRSGSTLRPVLAGG